MVNPVLIEIERGGQVESLHRGAAVVVDGAGAVPLRIGDIDAPVFPRSAVKVMQAIPLLTSGAAQAFGFQARELALACSSHNGEPRHVELAVSMLSRAGLDPGALECGAHAPSFAPAARALILAGFEPSALHNNCSGKHAGMLAVARHLGEPVKGYVLPDHPVQKRVAQIMSELAGATVSAGRCAVDGCSVPTWALPLQAWARAFASMAVGGGVTTEYLAAGHSLIAACMAEPAFVAGEKRFCTGVMEATNATVFVKTGAEGIFCAALPGRGLGIALKIDDGATRASEAAMAGLLSALVPSHEALFDRWTQRPVHSVAGATVGRVRLAGDFQQACLGLGRNVR